MRLIWPWQDRKHRLSWLKAGTFTLMFVPAIWLVYQVGTDQFGPVPLGGMTYWSGVWATALLLLALAITPALTVVGLIAGQLLTGSLFVETIFGIPGFGSLTVEALRQKDFPILMGNTVVAALFIMLSNLVVDLLYRVIDPRVSV